MINLSNLTLNAEEVRDFSKIVVKATLENPSLKALHNVQRSIKMKEQIVIADKLGLSGKKSNGCTRQSSGAQAIMSQKYWEPVGIEDTFSICQAEINSLFKAYYDKIEDFKQRYNIEGSDEAMFAASLISKAANDAIFRAIWFADKNIAAATSDASGLVDEADIDYYNYFDGIFAQIFAGVTAGTIKRVELGIDTETVSAAQAYKAFMDTYKSAPATVRANKDSKFYVSGQMFLGLVEYLQTQSVNGGDLTYTEDGFASVKFLGHDVVNMETVWDSNIQKIVADTTDNAVLFPHRIVFTTPNNIPVGTLNDEDFDTIEAWYNQDERTNKIAYGFTLDAKVLDEDMIIVAY